MYRGFIYSSENICVVTSDGRIILGELVGHDQVQNLILNDAKERVYSIGSPPETVDLGLYVKCLRNSYISLVLADEINLTLLNVANNIGT